MTAQHILVHDGHSASQGAIDLLSSLAPCESHLLPVEDGVTFLRDILKGASSSADLSLVFIVHCAPDGTCEKSVRKMTRGLKLEADEPCTMNMIKSSLIGPPHGNVSPRLLLLSGATCANSAAMAGPSIFAGGQRLRSALVKAGAGGLSGKENVRELHAELCDLNEAMQEVATNWLATVETATTEAPPAEASAEAAEEVNLFTNDGKVIHFQNPTVQTSDDGSYVVTGPSETKAVADMMPAIASQLGSDAEAATLGPAAKPPPIKTSPETRTKKSGSGDGAEGGGSAGERGFTSPQFMFRVVAVAAAAVAAASVFSALRRRDAARSYMHT